MKNILAVTTFNKEGLDLYGQRFLNSFAQNVDKEIRLICYAEKCQPENPSPNNILILDQEEALPDLVRFKKTWSDVPMATGTCPWPQRRPRDHHKTFKWDAVRFSNKVYAVFDACERAEDWCVWIDADTYVHSPWSHEEFSSILPDHVWLTYVGRGKSSQTWPECGFYGLKVSDAKCRQFVANFRYMYENANIGIFKLEEWHDSYVFGHVLDKFKQMYPDMYDYTKDMVLKQASTGGGGHPLINTVLGKWIDHLKGDRKRLQKSKRSDLTTKRPEKYWKQ